MLRIAEPSNIPINIAHDIIPLREFRPKNWLCYEWGKKRIEYLMPNNIL